MEKYRPSSGDDIVCRASSPKAARQSFAFILFSSEAVSSLRRHPEPQAKDRFFSASVIAFDPQKQT
jgi:hypothetical protein